LFKILEIGGTRRRATKAVRSQPVELGRPTCQKMPPDNYCGNEKRYMPVSHCNNSFLRNDPLPLRIAFDPAVMAGSKIGETASPGQARVIQHEVKSQRRAEEPRMKHNSTEIWLTPGISQKASYHISIL